MRVLYWSELFWPYLGGGELFSAQLISALQERGYEFFVVTSKHSPDLPDEARFKGIPIYRFPLRQALTAGRIDLFLEARRWVAKLKQTIKPDFIHLNGVSPSLLFHLQTAKVCPSPVFVRMNQQILPTESTRPNSFTAQILRSADWITCVSHLLLTQAQQLAPEISVRSSVILNGLDAPPLSPTPLSLKTQRLLCLGRLVHQKGFDLALTAFASLIKRFPQLRLIIGGDGPERPRLERQIADMGLGEVVDLIGWVAPNEVLTLLNTATVVLLPSRWEGLPSVALQAASMARPVVATRVGGLPEVVVHQQTGLLVEPEDSAGLAEAISFLLEHPEATMQMGQTARRRAQEMFGWQRCVDAYDTLYRQLATNGIH